jgi:hypothetical protein
MSLLESTKKLLDDQVRSGTKLREIAGASDGSVPLEWLYRFARDEIPNPGVKPIQSLHDCLKNFKSKSAA